MIYKLFSVQNKKNIFIPCTEEKKSYFQFNYSKLLINTIKFIFTQYHINKNV